MPTDLFDALDLAARRLGLSPSVPYVPEYGEQLMEAGERPGCVVLVESGEVVLKLQGKDVAVLGRGNLLNISQLASGARSIAVDVFAGGDCSVRVLELATIDGLRVRAPEQVARLEQYALARLMEAYANLDHAIKREFERAGTPWQPAPSSYFGELANLAGIGRWAHVGRGAVRDVMAQSYPFERASNEALDALLALFPVRAVERGTVLAAQFEVAESMYFIVDGRVEIGGSPEMGAPPRLVATAGPGTLVGVCGVLGTIRRSSMVAADRCTLIEFPAAKVHELLPLALPAGALLRRAMLRAAIDVIDAAGVARRALADEAKHNAEEHARQLRSAWRDLPHTSVSGR